MTFIKKIFQPIDLTKGNIYKVIILFMIPIVISYIFQNIYSLTDAIIVGQNLSASEVNGVNDVSSLTFIVLQFAFGCAAGFSVVSSNKLGNNDLNGVRQSFFAQFILSIIISIILTIISCLLVDPLLSLVGLNPTSGGATYQAAKAYITIIFIGLIGQVMYNQICSLLRSIGDSLTPLIFLIASTILNIGLDLLFIVVFHWGVEGAGIATILAQLISAILCYIYTFVKYPYLRFKKEDLKIPYKFYLKHLSLGIPLAFQFSILAIGLIVLQSTIIKFDIDPTTGLIIDQGPAQLAYGAYSKLHNFFNCPLNSLGTAMLSFVGQNYGANNKKRINQGLKAAIILNIIISVVLIGIMFLLMIDDFYLKIFYSESTITEDVSNLARLNIFSTFPLFPFLGFIFILRCSIQGVEKSYFSLIAGVGELIARVLLCLYAPYIVTNIIDASVVANILVNPWPYVLVCLADPIAWIIADIILGIGCYIYIYRPYKKETKLNKEENII